MNTKLFNLRWIIPLRGFLRWALLMTMILSMVRPTPAYAASLVVNTLGDELKGSSNGDCSLREAIKAANYNIAVDGCPAGDATSLDTISFAVSGTISLAAQLEVIGGGPLMIDGGNVITLSGRGQSTNIHGRVLYIRAAAEVTVESLTVVKGLEGYHGSKGATGDGGGIYNAGTLTVSNSTVSENQVFRWGGGIYNAGTLTIVNSIISGNISPDGGGIYNLGTLNIMDSAVSDNESGSGGGIENAGTLNITNSAISGNEAVFGGGIANGATLTLTNSTLSHNHGYFGGVIYNGGAVTITNSTLSDNLADSSGGGIYNNYYGTLDMNNSTVSGNHADYGGGIDSIGHGQITLRSSIITYNDYGDNCTGIPIIDAGYNIEDMDTCGFDPANGSLTNTDPLLGPLQDNGGPTLTHALLPGSPAIDAGDPLHCPATDQRGVKRPLDGNGDGIRICDIGSFEVQVHIK